MRDYSRNLMPYLSEVEPDEAGPDLAGVCKKYGIAPEDMILMSRNENPYGPSPRVREALDSEMFLCIGIRIPVSFWSLWQNIPDIQKKT